MKVPVDVHDLNIDPKLVGAAMRDELVIFYNKLVYWTERHSEWDAQKKDLENLLEEARDRAKALRATKAEELGMKAKIQEAFIRDFWEMPIEIADSTTGEISKTTCSHLMRKLSTAMQEETKSRHKMNLCNTALDIGRTAVSWDKQEYARQGGNV